MRTLADAVLLTLVRRPPADRSVEPSVIRRSGSTSRRDLGITSDEQTRTANAQIGVPVLAVVARALAFWIPTHYELRAGGPPVYAHRLPMSGDVYHCPWVTGA